MFWDAPKIESLPEAYRTMVFDMAVNSGPKRAIKTLQKILGVVTDGAIGQDTLAAANNSDPEEVVPRYLSAREVFYSRLAQKDPSQGKFLKGWLVRLNDLKDTLLG